MNNHQITIIYKVLSRLDKADYQSLVNTFEVQDDFKGFKLDETSLKNLHEIIKESNSVEEVIQVVNPSKNLVSVFLFQSQHSLSPFPSTPGRCRATKDFADPGI